VNQLLTSHAEEGRLTATTGDKPRAARVYTHYLAIRGNSDHAPLQATRDSVRRQLAQLDAEPN
jgi:hypothetical protein